MEHNNKTDNHDQGSLPSLGISDYPAVNVVSIHQCMGVGMGVLSLETPSMRRSYTMLNQNLEYEKAYISYALATPRVKDGVMDRRDHVKYPFRNEVLVQQTAHF